MSFARGWSAAVPLELYGTRSCQFTAELREELDWRGTPFVEYDVESDAAALQRFLQLAAGNRTVPLLVEDGKILQTGYNGRGCVVGPL